jgi:hypothetical protein
MLNHKKDKMCRIVQWKWPADPVGTSGESSRTRFMKAFGPWWRGDSFLHWNRWILSEVNSSTQWPCHANLHVTKVTAAPPDFWSVRWSLPYLHRSPLHTNNFCHALLNIAWANAQSEHSRETVSSQNWDFDHVKFTSSLISLNASVIKSYRSAIRTVIQLETRSRQSNSGQRAAGPRSSRSSLNLRRRLRNRNLAPDFSTYKQMQVNHMYKPSALLWGQKFSFDQRGMGGFVLFASPSEICQKTKTSLKKPRDRKCHVLSWMKR